MGIIEVINLLEDKMHYIVLRITQISEENIALKEEITKEKKKSDRLSRELESFREEKKKFELIRENVISKVEKLVYQLSLGEDNEDNSMDEGVDYKDKEGDNENAKDRVSEDFKESESNMLSSSSSATTINFLPEEE